MWRGAGMQVEPANRRLSTIATTLYVRALVVRRAFVDPVCDRFWLRRGQRSSRRCS